MEGIPILLLDHNLQKGFLYVSSKGNGRLTESEKHLEEVWIEAWTCRQSVAVDPVLIVADFSFWNPFSKAFSFRYLQITVPY